MEMGLVELHQKRDNTTTDIGLAVLINYCDTGAAINDALVREILVDMRFDIEQYEKLVGGFIRGALLPHRINSFNLGAFMTPKINWIREAVEFANSALVAEFQANEMRGDTPLLPYSLLAYPNDSDFQARSLPRTRSRVSPIASVSYVGLEPRDITEREIKIPIGDARDFFDDTFRKVNSYNSGMKPAREISSEEWMSNYGRSLHALAFFRKVAVIS